jgi:hypothetical protein
MSNELLFMRSLDFTISDMVVQVCEPGKSFKKDCNTCLCSEDGTSAYCTLMACLPPPHQEKRGKQ